METVEQPDIFERRYYEMLRCRAAAADLGRVAVADAMPDNTPGYEKRRYDEITSGLAEALDGVVKTDWAFEFKDGRLVAGDGQKIEELLLRGWQEAVRIAGEDRFFANFLPSRARHELDELREQEAMARGETGFNTIITFSPYSEEYDSPKTRDKLKKAAQEPQWKRAMIRVSHWDSQRLHIATRSVDQADIDLLSQTAKRQFGYDFEAQDSTAMLGERIGVDCQDGSWRHLADSLADQADIILREHHGGEWIQGRPASEARDTQKFVESQRDIIEGLLEVDGLLAGQLSNFISYKQAFDREIYNHIALLKKRMAFGENVQIVDVPAASASAGAIARADGEIYSMCGYTLNPNGSEAALAARTGFESIKLLAGKKVECPFCNEKVMVPKEDLDRDRLYCRECDTGIFVCSGKKFRKGLEKRKKTKSPPPKEGEWQRIKRQRNEKNEIDRQKRNAEQAKKRRAARQFHRAA